MTTTRRTVADVTKAVATYTAEMDLEGRDWQKAVALRGLLACDQHVDSAQHGVDRSIETQTSAGQFSYGCGNYPKEWGKWTDYEVDTYNPTTLSASIAECALEFYNRTGDDRYLEAVEKQTAYLYDLDRTTDGGFSRRRNHIELWTETMCFVCPYLVQLGRVTDSPSHIDTAIEQIQIHTAHLQDPHTKLFRHIWREDPNSYPASSFWSRGNGWAIAGLLDTLLNLPTDYEDGERVETIFRETIEALVQLQDDSGFWHQKVDDPSTRLESSGTLIFSYALRKALNHEVLSGAVYEDAAWNAFKAVMGVVDNEGGVQRVSRPPANAQSPLGVTPYGQGWFLLASSCFSTEDHNE